MKLANPTVTGRLIPDARYRADWLALVQALQLASETPGGPLEGWVFHGTDSSRADEIASVGMESTTAHVPTDDGDWDEQQGCHFGSANLAAFYAEDYLESDSSLDLAIFAAPLDLLAQHGELTGDAMMVLYPVPGRMRLDTEQAIEQAWEASAKDWQASLRILETVIVLGDIPRTSLVQLRHLDDLHTLLDDLSELQQESENPVLR